MQTVEVVENENIYIVETMDNGMIIKQLKSVGLILTLEEIRISKISVINAQAQDIILAKYPLWVQSNCANGIYPSGFAAQMRADISAIIVAANIATEAVMTATTIANVNAVTPIWPVI